MDEAVKALIATPLTRRSAIGPITRMPLVAPAIALVVGIASGLLAPMTTGFWLVLGAAALVAAGIMYRARHLHQAQLFRAPYMVIYSIFCINAPAE